MTGRFVRATSVVLVVYVVLISITGFQFSRMSTGFIPEQDQGYLAAVVQLPPGSSLDRTDKVVKEVNGIILSTPGIEHTSPLSGIDVTTQTNAPNSGTVYIGLPSLYGHRIPRVNAAEMIRRLRERLKGVNDAFVLVVQPPPVQGLGSPRGFKLMLEDRGGVGPEALAKAANTLVNAANHDPAFAGAFTLVTGGLWAVWGTSPGKRALHLRIVDADTGERMTVRQAGLRTLGYLLSFATCGAGFLWVLFNPRKQALHDRIANTVVIDDSAAKGWGSAI